MPHLKFNRDDWDENGLYFVEFTHLGNKILRKGCDEKSRD